MAGSRQNLSKFSLPCVSVKKQRIGIRIVSILASPKCSKPLFLQCETRTSRIQKSHQCGVIFVLQKSSLEPKKNILEVVYFSYLCFTSEAETSNPCGICSTLSMCSLCNNLNISMLSIHVRNIMLRPSLKQ